MAARTQHSLDGCERPIEIVDVGQPEAAHHDIKKLSGEGIRCGGVGLHIRDSEGLIVLGLTCSDGPIHLLATHAADMTHAVCMRRTTIFLTEDLDRLLQETARRTQRPQAEIVREALSQYLNAKPRPWPRSVGMGADADPTVTSDNVKGWVRDRWRHEMEQADKEDAAPPTC